MSDHLKKGKHSLVQNYTENKNERNMPIHNSTSQKVAKLRSKRCYDVDAFLKSTEKKIRSIRKEDNIIEKPNEKTDKNIFNKKEERGYTKNAIAIVFGDVIVQVWVKDELIPRLVKPYSYFYILTKSGNVAFRKEQLITVEDWTKLIHVILLEIYGYISKDLTNSTRYVLLESSTELKHFRSLIPNIADSITGHKFKSVLNIDTLLSQEKESMTSNEYQFRQVILGLCSFVDKSLLDLIVLPIEPFYLFSCCQLSGIVVDIGHFSTRVTPVIEGMCLDIGFGKSVKSGCVYSAGADVTLWLAKNSKIVRYDSIDFSYYDLSRPLYIDIIDYTYKNAPLIKPEFQIWEELKSLIIKTEKILKVDKINTTEGKSEDKCFVVEIINSIPVLPSDIKKLYSKFEIGDFVIIPTSLCREMYTPLLSDRITELTLESCRCNHNNCIEHKMKPLGFQDVENIPRDLNVVDFLVDILSSKDFPIDLRFKLPILIIGGNSHSNELRKTLANSIEQRFPEQNIVFLKPDIHVPEIWKSLGAPIFATLDDSKLDSNRLKAIIGTLRPAVLS